MTNEYSCTTADYPTVVKYFKSNHQQIYLNDICIYQNIKQTFCYGEFSNPSKKHTTLVPNVPTFVRAHKGCVTQNQRVYDEV